MRVIGLPRPFYQIGRWAREAESGELRERMRWLRVFGRGSCEGTRAAQINAVSMGQSTQGRGHGRLGVEEPEAPEGAKADVGPRAGEGGAQDEGTVPQVGER